MIESSVQIFNYDGNLLKAVPLTKDCEWVEELMQSDNGVLSWVDNTGETLPAGCYINKGAFKYVLLEPYTPKQKDEYTWEYKPVFESEVRSWGKVPFFHYNYINGLLNSKEPDWVLTDTPVNFMRSVVTAIENETGQKWTYSVEAGLIPTATVSFQSVDIISALNDIASAFETEWIAYKDTKEIRLGSIARGDALPLQIGVDLPLPQVKENNKEWYNRFYAFGSTRNITQDYQAASTNNLVNKRLTLDATKYPNGYKDIRTSEDEPIYSTILVFDDVYPHSELAISGVRARLMYRKSSEDGSKVIIGTDSNGQPIYDQYAIWFFKIPDFEFVDKTYSEDNPDGMKIAGKNLSVHFKDGMLAGREFELRYRDKTETLTDSDGVQFEVQAGDYEIQFIEENGFIIPSMTGITPADGDNVILFNIRMPQEYVKSAQVELEEALDKEINERGIDRNSYTFKTYYRHSHPDAEIYVGRNVRLTFAGKTLDSRIIRLVTKMDYGFEQELTVDNEVIKGTTEQLKEDIVNANKNIDILAEFNRLTRSVTQGYERAQQAVIEGFDRLGRMWQYDENGDIYTENNAYSKGSLSALGGVSGGGGTTPGGGETAPTTLGGLINVDDGADNIFGSNAQLLIKQKNADSWSVTPVDNIVGLDETALATYLTQNNYAKLSDIPSLDGYMTIDYANQNYQPKGDYLTEHQSLDNYYTKSASDNRFQPKGNYLTSHQPLYNLIFKAGAYNGLNSYNPTISTAQTLNIPTTTTHISEGSNLYFTIPRVTGIINPIIGDLRTQITDSLNEKLDKVTFDDLFVKETLSDGSTVIKAQYSLYTQGFMSALGSTQGIIAPGIEIITEAEVDELFPPA